MPHIELDQKGRLALRVEGHEGTHHVHLPPTAEGMETLVRILRAERTNRAGRLGTVGKPTQSTVEAMLRALNGSSAPIRRAEDLLNDLHMEELDL